MKIKSPTSMNASPDSVLVPLPQTDAWLWYDTRTTRLITPQAGFSIEELEIEGFMPFPIDYPSGNLPIHLMLQSQLLSSLLYSDTEGKSVCFTASDSIHRITEKAPVFLGSLQDFPEATMMIQHPYPYPPKEHGTTAIILDKNQQYQYYFKDLPLATQERQKAISQLIEEMQSIPQEETFSVFVDCPEELQAMVQQLAEDYYNHHHQKQQSIPAMADVFNNGMTDIFTFLPFQAFPAAAISRKPIFKDGKVETYGDWQQELTDKENEVILSYAYTKPSGTIYLQVRGDATGTSRDMVMAELIEHIKKKSDLDSDVFLAMIAQLMRGTKDEQGNTWISAQQILKYRGIRPKMNKTDSGREYTGGHRWEDIEEISHRVKSMERDWIKIHELEIIDETTSKSKRKRPRKTISRESRLFMFGDKITHRQQSLDDTTNEIIDVAWQYRESSWMLPFIEGPNRFTGILFEKVLNYDPYHEKWEKRLSKHFLFWLRTNASRERKPYPYIGELLKELNLDIDEERPHRTKDRFEKAMDRLAGDGILTWDYKEKFNLPPRKWLPTWLQQQITVEDPPMVKNQYASIKAKAQVIRAEQRAVQQKKAKKTNGKEGK